ncbi:MAG: hypothetical protein PHU25_01505 [Deltaproteobacteria bacterium]|nr:hypothetical protein [Deltaproteobacteria bacterium]
MRRIIWVLLVVAIFGAPSRVALANEYTDVIDAFDNDINDPFDLNLTVGYEYQNESALIRRETFSTRYVPRKTDYFAYLDMFEYSRSAHLLNFKLEIGLYKDISIHLRLPLILQDSRSLKEAKYFDARDWSGSNELFALPFTSPDRSGVDYFAVGANWGILDQSRDDTKPNWGLYLEGRFSVGDALEASCRGDQRIPLPPTGATSSTCKDLGLDKSPGISRGLNEVSVGTRLSRRYGVADPFFGIEALLGWPKDGTTFQSGGANSGAINKNPPMVGSLDFGIEFIPWEMMQTDRNEAERRIVMGIALGGSYHSEGREYTPLFDALGTSQYLDERFGKDTGITGLDFNGDGKISRNEKFSKDYVWTGMTDVENYATFYGKLFLAVQPARYVKFRLTGGLTHVTEHFITKTDQCASENMATNGECGVYNWDNRPQIDAPGTRFRVEDDFVWSFNGDVMAQF